MIDWIKAEYWPNLRLVLRDGSILYGGGNGIELGEDFDDEFSGDVFFVATNEGPLAIPVDDIQKLEFLPCSRV